MLALGSASSAFPVTLVLPIEASFCSICATERAPRSSRLYRMARSMNRRRSRHSSENVTFVPNLAMSSAISSDMSLEDRCLMASRWSSLHMPNFDSASFHEIRTTSWRRTTDSPQVFGGSVKSESAGVFRCVYHAPMAAAATPAAAMLAMAGARAWQ